MDAKRWNGNDETKENNNFFFFLNVKYGERGGGENPGLVTPSPFLDPYKCKRQTVFFLCHCLLCLDACVCLFVFVLCVCCVGRGVCVCR